MRSRIIRTFNKAIEHDEALRENASLSERVIGDKADVVTAGDIEIGDLIIKCLTEDTEDKIIIESEEHGKEQNFGGDWEDYYIAIDDIDGSNNLRVGTGILPYASMIVVFDGSKKRDDGTYSYDDYVYAACIDYASKKLFYTEKGLGHIEEHTYGKSQFKLSTENAQDNRNLALTLSTDVVSTQRGGATGYAAKETDDVSVLPSVLDGVYKSFAIVDSGCSVFEYAMVGMGIRNGYVSSGKKEHELPLLYAFCRETGLDMVDFEGKSYQEMTYNFEGKDAEVIAGDEATIEKVRLLITKQKLANKKINDMLQKYVESQKGTKNKNNSHETRED